MNIFQIVCTFPPYKGGIGNVAYEFSRRLVEAGHDVVVLTPNYNSTKLKSNSAPLESPNGGFQRSVKIVRLQPFLQFGNAAVLNKIGEQLKNFDIIHLHYPFFGTAEFVYLFKKKFPEKKLVIIYHMDAIGNGIKNLFFKLYAKFIMPKILAVADLITVSSIDYIENSDAKKFYQNNKNKFIELPFGVDLEHFKPQEKDKDLMNKFGIQYDDKIILFVGGLDKAHYFKGLEILISAVDLCLRDPIGFRKPLKLIIVGEGDLKNYYQNLIKKLNLEDIIKFAGAASHDDLPKYYNLCDLFVLPSINRAEAFGLVLLEAMACGKAVLASKLPGVRNIPPDNQFCLFKTGNIQSLADKIFNLLNNDELRIKLGECGRQKAAEKYNWDNITKL